MNFRTLRLDLEKAEEPEIKLPTSAGSEKARESQKNVYFCFIDYAKAFDCVDHSLSNLPEKEAHLAKEALIFLQMTKLSP